MTIHLPTDMERSIEAAMHSGRFASVDEAMIRAAHLLLQETQARGQAHARR
jgi:Arc/MetJ-type ribon-helix-helix transcriptional regulator